VSQFLPADAEDAVSALLVANLPTLNVGSIAEADINADGQLVFRTPCARTRYAGTQYASLQDNRALNYDCEHMIEVWCAASNLRSKQAQREDTKTLVELVLPQLAGARLAFSDDSTSEPVRSADIHGVEQDIVGTVYIITVAVPGIAQFPGTYA
jgi:hypothetical protein